MMQYWIYRALFLVTLLTNITLATQSSILWQIGKSDRDFREFASDTSTYSQQFPQDVTFTVGGSDPATHFFGIHPGPLDDWAGRREHTYAIHFTLPTVPAGAYELQLNLVNARREAPPTLRVDINGRSEQIATEPGGSDLVLLHPDKGTPQTLRFVFDADGLKVGENHIAITNQHGSWLLYDIIQLRHLSPTEPPKINISVQQSIFFVEREGKLKQECLINLDGLMTSAPVEIECRHDNDPVETFTFEKSPFGMLHTPLYLTAVERPRELTVRVTAGEQTAITKLMQTPQRKWRIYVAPATHTDIGYTDIQSKVIDLHNRNTDLALQLAQEFPLYHWNLESSWAAQMWLRDRLPQQHEALYEAARNKRIGIESGYLNILTGLCSEEELIRNLYYSARLHREKGVPFESMTLTDAPSHVWTTPSILAGAGIRYLSVGINGTRAPLLKQNIHHKSPFWWVGPDGQKILTWFTAGYSQAAQIGLREGADNMRKAIERDLTWWNARDDYSFDAILLHGAYSDNVAISRDLAESLTEYTKRYAYPQVILCANNDFFQYIEAKFPAKIQTLRGCGGSWWEDGAGSTAYETAINRNTHQEVIAAETVWATLAGLDLTKQFPQNEFNHIWDNVLLYDEHTWGAHNSITEPTSDFVQRQWAVKAAYATEASQQTQHLLQNGLATLASAVHADSSDAGALLVYNPSGQVRSDIAEVKIPQGVLIQDGEKITPQQMIDRDALGNVTVRFRASDVPAVGYRTFRLMRSKDTSAAVGRFDKNVLENDFYRITFDVISGGISGIVDKKLDREIVDASSKYKLGQLIYAAGGAAKGPDGKEVTQVDCPNIAEVKLSSPKTARVEAGLSGPLMISARTLTSHPLFPHIEMEVQLSNVEPRIDFVFRLRKNMTFDKEAVYIAFPFAGRNPQFRYEIGGGDVRPNEEHLPGGCRDWFAVQRWITMNAEGSAVALSPMDTPLVTLCDLTPGKWLDTLDISNGTVFAYVMNNYWFTNYKAGQDGDFTFRYSLTSGAKIEPDAANQFGEAIFSPLRTVFISAASPSSNLPPNAGFCQVKPNTVTLTTLKRAEDGKGLICRVRETTGQDADVVITGAFKGLTKAARCDLVERTQEPLDIHKSNDGIAVRLKLKAYSRATIRFE
jgi:alpha-mannosidase